MSKEYILKAGRSGRAEGANNPPDGQKNGSHWQRRRWAEMLHGRLHDTETAVFGLWSWSLVFVTGCSDSVRRLKLCLGVGDKHLLLLSVRSYSYLFREDAM
jgi:hypothetical protein